MNKFLKTFLSIFGAIELVFSIYSPLLLSFLVVGFVKLSPINQQVLLFAGFGASLFRAIKVFIK